MPHSLSAKKRVRQSIKRQRRNRQRKKTAKVALKKFSARLAQKDISGGEAALRENIRLLDRLASKGTLHRRTAARRKSRLMRAFNAWQASPLSAPAPSPPATP